MKKAGFLILLVLFALRAEATLTPTVDVSGPFVTTNGTAPYYLAIPTQLEFQVASDLTVLDVGKSSAPRVPASVLQLGSDYTVTGGGYTTSTGGVVTGNATEMQTGNITIKSGMANSVLSGDLIYIVRSSKVNQITAFSSGGYLTGPMIEQALDKTAMISQNAVNGVATSLHVESWETKNSIPPNLLMPLATRAGKYVAFDKNGNVMLTTNSVSTTNGVQFVTGTAGQISAITTNNNAVISLVATSVTPGSYTNTNLTVDSYGRITSASTGNTGVTSVSAVGQNGIGAVVTTPNTTPVITLNLGAITPSSVTTSGLETVGSLRTSNLTGYLYGNGPSNVTASTTIPAANVTGLATVATTGNYNDLIGKPTLNAGTVTSVATTGSVNGITLTGGTITSSGTITLGGTLSGISNSQLTNNSITVTAGTGLSGGGTVALGGAITLNATGTGTVSSVSVSPNSGVTAGVTNSTTTPTISIGLGAITPTSVTTNTMTFGVNTGVLTVSTGIVGSAAITGSGQAVFNSGPSIAAPTITGAATAVNLTTSGLESVANLKTTGLTGYLYGNSTTNVTASTTIPTSSLSGSVSLTSQVSGILPIANGGTGSSTASLVAGTGIAITGTFPNQTINATGGTGTVTSVSGAGSVNGITLTGTVTTSGSLTLGGTLGSITNSQLTNNSITIAGTSTALGGSISQDTITGLSTTGIVKRTGANTLAIATSGSDYAPATSTTNILYGNGSGGFSPVTVGSGLSFTAGTLASTSAGGSVTNVSVTPNSGVLAGVTNPSTTPAISIGLGNITPLSVTSNAGSFTTLNSSGQTLLATSSGLLGIGVTPAAWSVGGKAFDLGFQGNGLYTYGPNNVGYVSNAYYNGTNWINASSTNSANFLNFSGGSMFFNYATGGTLGSTISWTTGMTLANNGILSIASTAASSSTSSGALVVGNGSSGGLGVGGNGYFGGNVFGNTFVTVPASSSYGSIDLVAPYTNHSGYVEFIANNGNRQGYIGYSDTTGTGDTGRISYQAGTHQFIGNVGIGTDSPSYKLVASSGTSGTSIASDFSGGIATGTEYSALKFTASAYSYIGSEIRGINTNGGVNLGVMAFYTSGSERMRIDSSGNVLVGATANLTGGDSLLFAQGSIWSNYGNSGLSANSNEGYLLFNSYYNGSQNVARNNGYGGRLAFNLSSGYLDYSVGASATAGNPPSGGYNSVMRMYPSYVYVTPTTSSSSTTSGALQVAGGVGITGNAYVGGVLAVNGAASNGYITATSATYLNSAFVGISTASSNGTAYQAGFTASSGSVMYIYTSSGSAGGITVSGTTTAYNTTSDKRLKTPLRSWSLGDRFDDLPIGEFNWLKDGSVGHGTLAQEMYKVYPDVVVKGNDAPTLDSNKQGATWGVDYGKLTVPVIAEVKALRARVKTLEQEQADTQKQLNDLTAKFNQYISTHP